MQKNLNFVFVASEQMRAVEYQLMDSLVPQLEDWKISTTLLKRRPSLLNFTFFISRPGNFFMSHGVADKNYLFRVNASGEPEIKKYQRVFLPGPWLKQRLIKTFGGAIKKDNLIVCGWPRLDLLLEAQSAGASLQQPGARRRILWAPMLSGTTGTSSYPRLMGEISALRKEFDVDISVHPADRNGGASTFQQLLAADAVISDHGTLVYEAWALGKPVIFPTWLIRDEVLKQFPGSAEARIYQDSIGLHADGARDLIRLAGNAKGVGRDVKDFLKDYLPPETYGRSAAIIGREIENVRQKTDVNKVA